VNVALVVIPLWPDPSAVALGAVQGAMFVGVGAAVGVSALRDVFLGLPTALLQVGSLYRRRATAGTPILWAFGAAGEPARR
jgi:hypothetical protein